MNDDKSFLIWESTK